MGGTTYKPVVYDEAVVKLFALASLFWAIIAFVMGVYVATLLVFPELNFGEYLTFGRLRPVHTSAAIIAFGGNFLIGSSLYVVQRTCHTNLFGNKLAHYFLFFSYQIFIVLAAVSYVLGYTQGKEYAEPEWILDLFLEVIWVLYAVIFIGTLIKRQEKHIYVSNWFYLAFIITVALLHTVNNLVIPVSYTGMKSYSLFSGPQDAMVQWWYGHNMVGFLLTAGFIGAMYYFIPKQAERPIYSYRLSIVHFWALIFMYIWAGPHHLHYTALPDWTQTLGMVFSIMLWMPSWGGMINGIMTLSGAWEKLRTDPIIRFLVVAVAFYGMSTFEGPLMAIKAVNSLSHYTDWTVSHVHSGALGWNALIAFGSLYYMIPKLWNKKLYSLRLVEWHFWLASIGIILYVTSMWYSGISQGVMWRAYDDAGFLKYSFIEIVEAIKPYHLTRIVGGIFFLLGGLVMVYNIIRTICSKDTVKINN
ncbi:MAG: cytochrome-c oxidase, cbb3-type subunit I [Alphaproteobacteria bacterium]|jgi:cytochrome c oxidase cbb3-type subunit 1